MKRALPIVISTDIFFFINIDACTTVTCSFTIDNNVDSASYNQRPLIISTDDLNNWGKEKTVSFESCYDGSPGTLSINGFDLEPEGTQGINTKKCPPFLTNLPLFRPFSHLFEMTVIVQFHIKPNNSFIT